MKRDSLVLVKKVFAPDKFQDQNFRNVPEK